MSYNIDVKLVSWEANKNKQLIQERGVGFEDVLAAVQNGGLIDVIENLNERHIGQRCLIVDINGYLHVVPFVETENEIFLKTIFPSRKLKKKYAKKKSNP